MGRILLAIVATAILACARPASAQGGADAVAPAVTGGSTFFAVQVSDADAAAAWYTATLGLTEVRRIDDEGGRYSIRLLVGPGLTVELIRLDGAGAAGDRPSLGLFKVGFDVDDIEAFHARLLRRSADADARIFTDTVLGARSFVFRDPDGNRLQVFELCRGECPESAP